MEDTVDLVAGIAMYDPGTYLETLRVTSKTSTKSDTMTRIQLLDTVDRAIHTVAPKTINAVVETLKDITVLGRGAQGIVFSGCVKEGSKCMKLEDGSDVETAVKIILGHKFKGGMKVYGFSDDFTGAANPLREALAGRLLNRLVKNGNTPHAQLLYMPVHVPDIPKDIPTIYSALRYKYAVPRGPKNGIATYMELNNQDMHSFMKSKPTPRSLRIAIIQLTQGLLAARTHFGFSHNDFHTANAMMDHIPHEVYRYVVDGRSYDVPTDGMLWKIIDPGFATMAFFHEGEMHSIWSKDNADMTAKHAQKTDRRILDISPQLFDIARMMFAMRNSTNNWHLKAELSSMIGPAIRLTDGIDTMRESMAPRSEPYRADDKLLRAFFHNIAKDFVSTEEGAPDATFMTDAPIKIDDPLTEFEDRHLVVTRDGGLAMKRVEPEPEPEPSPEFKWTIDDIAGYDIEEVIV